MHSRLIEIFYPTYKNVDTFEFVLRSCLEQDYQNIRVHVYDNALPEGYVLTSELIDKIGDSRIVYHKNIVNFGALGNYSQIFSDMKKTSLSICLAADIGFTSGGLSRMYEALLRTGATVVFPSGVFYRHRDIVNNRDALYEVKDSNVVERFPGESEVVQPGIEIVQEYFSENNINGEYNDFSFFGALIVSPVLHALDTNFNNYRYHGFEHYLSMDLAINSNFVARLSAPCKISVIDSPRIGGTERPCDHYTRLEPIAACQSFLKAKYMALREHYGDMEAFFLSQEAKCEFFRNNYDGFTVEVESLLKASKKRAFS